jgi:hypothetical protein
MGALRQSIKTKAHEQFYSGDNERGTDPGLSIAGCLVLAPILVPKLNFETL